MKRLTKPKVNQGIEDEKRYAMQLSQFSKSISNIINKDSNKILDTASKEIANQIKSITTSKKKQRLILSALKKGIDHYVSRFKKVEERLSNGEITLEKAEKILMRTEEISKRITALEIREIAPKKTDYKAVADSMIFSGMVGITLAAIMAGIGTGVGAIPLGAAVENTMWAPSAVKFFHTTLGIGTGFFSGILTVGLTSGKDKESGYKLHPARLWKVYDEKLQEKFYNKVSKKLGLDNINLELVPKPVR